MHQISKVHFVTKLYMFRASSVLIIMSYKLYTWQSVCFMQVMWPLPREVRLERSIFGRKSLFILTSRIRFRKAPGNARLIALPQPNILVTNSELLFQQQHEL